MERGKKKRSFDSFLEDLKEAAIAYSRQPINTISSNTASPPLYTTTNTNISTMMPYTLSKKEKEVMQQPWPEASYPPLGAWEELLYTHTFDERFNWIGLHDDYDEAVKSSTYSDLILDFDMMLEKSSCFDNSSFFSSSSSSTLPPSISTFSTPSDDHSSSINGIQLPIHSHSSSNSPSPPISIDNKSQLVIHASSSSSSSSSSLCHPPIYVENICLASPVSSCSVVVEHEKHLKRGNQKEPKRERDEKAKKEKDVPKLMIVTRSPQVDVLEYGFRWRKYGQKSLKNNIYPRSYYKCTQKTCHAQKRVQRCGVDNEYVLTTYHGKHSHPANLSLPTHFGGYNTSLACE